ncbi:hypothetical protein FQA39_LY06783 [Lamprigera yunnana]|nr:hypothetical protein FQA39_LY06783 [Lamprigera yunnana]
MLANSELACVYASLILTDDDIAITGEKIQTILKAANVDVEPYWPGLFAKALEGVNVKDLITKIGSGAGTAPAAAAPASGAPAGAAAPAVAKEEKKESEPEESDDDMGLGLFD